MRFDDLESQSVAILGVGREGQAVWRQLRRRFGDKSLSFFAESSNHEGFIKTLNPLIDRCHIGPFLVDTLRKFDVLVRSAGVSPYRDELQQLRSLGVQFTTASNLWFAENPDAKTICISGTKGKSTTASLTSHLLADAGLKTRLAGNIGRPMLDFENSAVDWWVIELSSYQISDLEAEPDIVVLLNLSDEHVDWHAGADRYRSDKLRLAELAVNGRLIANGADPLLVQSLENHPDVCWFNQPKGWQAQNSSVSRSFSDSSVAGLATPATVVIDAPASLPGEHNMHNLAAALTVMEVLGLNTYPIQRSLSLFTGLAHRLQNIGEKAGIRFVDDSISTTPVSVAAALQTIGADKVVLLLGGMDRGLGWDDFAGELVANPPYAIVTMPDNGAQIYDCLERAGVEPLNGLHQANGLLGAVKTAQELVPENGCVLLSPGAPSFPHFRDFEERGEMFAKYAGLSK